MFLTPEQTGGPRIFALRRHDRYLAIGHDMCAFIDIEELAQALGRGAGETWQEHASLILLACCGGGLFEWLEARQASGDAKNPGKLGR